LHELAVTFKDFCFSFIYRMVVYMKFTIMLYFGIGKLEEMTKFM